jgi:sugar/nucleoside kinase (ribokinase family)
MTSPTVFCYGEIGVDNLILVDRLPTPEIAVFPSGDSYHVGGAAANTAVWLAHLGLDVALGGNAIGLDQYGQWLWDWLSRDPRLDLRHVERQVEVATPFCRVLVTPDAERSFLIFGYRQAPKTPLTTQMLAGARFVALDLYGGPERLAALEAARAARATTVVGDVIWPDHPALPMTDIVLNSGAFVRDTFPGADLRAHAHQLQAVSRGVVITSNGPGQVYVIDQAGSTFTVQPPVVPAIDATGAGDAFRAGLLFGLTQGWDLPRSVCWGVAAGALKVQRLGAASNLPPAAEVAALAGTLGPQPADLPATHGNRI